MTDSPEPADASDDDRRDHNRQLTCVVAEIETEDKSSLALIRNVSRSGALLYVARQLPVDSPVELAIHTTADPRGKKIHATGTIVRRKALDIERTDLWHWEIGVQFDEPIAANDEELETLAQELGRR